MKMPIVFDDGGRAAAGIPGRGSDCVVRAIAIATRIPYMEVSDEIRRIAKKHERPGPHKRGSNPRTGIWRATYERFMKQIDWEWMPTMFVGSGCLVHLAIGELPHGRLVVSVSHHMVAVINGIIHDTEQYFDVSRNGTRCVYGIYYDPNE